MEGHLVGKVDEYSQSTKTLNVDGCTSFGDLGVTWAAEGALEVCGMARDEGFVDVVLRDLGTDADGRERRLGEDAGCMLVSKENRDCSENVPGRRGVREGRHVCVRLS